jgi:hypothetical protein
MNLDSALYRDNGQTLHIVAAWLLLFSPAYRKSAKIGKQITKIHRVAKTSLIRENTDD